ncbi:MAG TPA: PDZ domain-containing protein [Myxococcaceae bacterium]|nr:PDZ domain-containing protein [Myxococcaceae bacterium]
MRVKRILLLPAILAVTPAVAAEQEAAPLPHSDPAVSRAIARVYPALVQIIVLTTHTEGGRERKSGATGSGAIISPEGHVITNHHVVGRATSIRVVLPTREELGASLVGTDPLSDIAVIQLDLSKRPKGSPPLPVAVFGASEAVRVGDTVLAMGCPLSLSQAVTRGIVANVDLRVPRPVELEGENVGSVVKWIGHDAQIFPGNSGGPLVNLEGEIIGINELVMGLGAAIPSDLARVVAQQLIAKRKVERAWTGMSFQPLLKDSPPATTGVLVSGVLPETPAATAGVQPGDRIIEVEGRPVTVRFDTQLPAFINDLLQRSPGKPMAIRLVRGTQTLVLTLSPVQRDASRAKEREFKEWGMTGRRITRLEAIELQRADTKGVVVGTLRPGGPADKAVPALHREDVIVSVAGKAVESPDALAKATAAIVKTAKAPVPTMVGFERGGEKLLTVVEVGIRPPQEPPQEARRGWLPVNTQVLSPKLATALGYKGRKGARVTQILPDGDASGLRVGDVVTKVDDALVEASEPQDTDVFDALLRAYQPGSKAVLAVLRDGKPLELTVTLKDAPRLENELRVYEDVALEFRARDISYVDRVKRRWPKETSGALVSQVDAGGWAAVGGLRSDDLVLAVDGKTVRDVKELERVLRPIKEKKPDEVVFFVRRGVQTHFVEVQPTWGEAKEATR